MSSFAEQLNASMEKLALEDPDFRISPYTEAGYQAAGEWLEAISTDEAFAEADFDVSDLLLAYAHLIDLDYKPMGHELRLLRKEIDGKLNVNNLRLETCQDVWSLRHLPFTEPFIKQLIRRLAIMYKNLDENSLHPAFFRRMREDEEYGDEWQGVCDVMMWLVADANLRTRVEQMLHTLFDQPTLEEKKHRPGFKVSADLWKKVLGC